MAYEDYSYDPMGNYTGYGSADYSMDEEERKKREEALRKQQEEQAGQVVHKQEVETRADGSQSITTTAERPPAPVAPQRPVQAPQAVRPVMPNMDIYNAGIAQAESGGNANIGYHNPQKGTAYGPYGITQAAWADARKANPNLPADITQANPEQMAQAQNQVTSNNARYLQSYGVPVNQNTLAAAHFLGAKGLSDYLSTGTISPQAAAANGGVDNVRRIVDQRLGGTMAPASGAVAPEAQAQPTEQPQAQPSEQGPVSPYALTAPQGTGIGLQAPAAQQPAGTESHIQAYQDAQNDPAKLMQMGFNNDMPEWMRERARNRAADLVTQQREKAKAEEQIATATPTELSRYLTKKTTEGSWGKFIMYGMLGMKTLQAEEATKLGMGTEKLIVGPDGKGAIIKYGLDGTPIEGFNSEGKKLSAEELVGIGSGAATKGVTQHGTIFTDPTGNVKGSWILETRPGSTPIYKQVGTGRVASADESAILSKTLAGKPQTSQSMGYDTAGNVISHTVHPDGSVTWKNETTGRALERAPEGYHTGKDQRQMLGDQAFKQSMVADEAENRKNAAAGLAPMFTPAQIQSRAQAKRDAIIGLSGPSAATPQVAGGVALPTPAAQGPAVPLVAGGAPTGPVAEVATAPARTGALAPEIEAQAQAIARGDVAMPTGMGAANRRNQAIQNRVYEINPSYDPTIFAGRKKTEDAFTTGKQGDVVRSMNVSIDHLDTLGTAAKALNNGQIPLFNDIANKFATNTGQPAPTNFDALKTLVGSEVAKAIQGGATALGDREEIRHEINNARSPQQLAGVIDKYQHLLAGQMAGLKTQYESGGGRRWDNKINPRTQEIMDQIEKEKKPQTGSGLPAPYADKSKEARYQEWLKKRNQGQ